MKSMYYWLTKHVHARHSTAVFALLVFIEGFFVMPVMTILTFFCLENRSKSFLYATIATFVSVAAAFTGYYIGLLLWGTIGQEFIYYIISPQTFTKLTNYYRQYQASTVLMVTLTPIPFKALTLTAGFCKLPLIPFLFYALIGRGIKFYAIATAVYIWGHHVQHYLDKYFYIFVSLFIGMFIFMWWLIH